MDYASSHQIKPNQIGVKSKRPTKATGVHRSCTEALAVSYEKQHTKRSFGTKELPKIRSHKGWPIKMEVATDEWRAKLREREQAEEPHRR